MHDAHMPQCKHTHTALLVHARVRAFCWGGAVSGGRSKVKKYEVCEDTKAVRTALDEKQQVEESQPVINAIVEKLEQK